ncbi:MAG: AMP-binding protein [Firmicutes bacterium]|nr:AMP-binding protein [Bacillota bacterium]
MQLYKEFCTEEFDEKGAVKKFELKYDDTFNFGYDVVDRLGKDDPDGRAVVWCNVKGDERIFTFKEISELSSKAANVFLEAGVQKGDRVMVILKRNYEYWYVAPALHKIGAVIIPATNMLTTEDIMYRINSVDVKYAVITSESEIPEKMGEAKKQCPSLKMIFGTGVQPEGVVNFTEAVANAASVLERVETNVTEPMLLYFTSGTTGYPKAVTHNHTYPLAHIPTARYWQRVIDGGLHLTVAETGWAKASWGKIYGQWICGSAVMVYDFDTFAPKKILNVMAKHHVTTFCAPPTIYRCFTKCKLEKYDLSSLTHLTTAGEAINTVVIDNLYEQTGIKIAEGFGQSESVLMIGNLENDTPSPNSMGRPSPLYDIRLLKNDGTYASAGETGEIVVVPKDNQCGIFMDYYNNHELYESVWEGGVYHTGDLAYFDDNNCYYYVSRKDDVIKSRGFRIGPFEIENKLMEHPAVMECSVVGVPDKDRGQAVKASVVLAADYSPSDALMREIKTTVNNSLAFYKHIHILEFVDELPKTISGKVRRTELRANA